jgi:hypothetical protein
MTNTQWIFFGIGAALLLAGIVLIIFTAPVTRALNFRQRRAASPSQKQYADRMGPKLTRAIGIGCVVVGVLLAIPFDRS